MQRKASHRRDDQNAVQALLLADGGSAAALGAGLRRLGEDGPGAERRLHGLVEEERVGEGHHLERLAEAHGVREHAAEARAAVL